MSNVSVTPTNSRPTTPLGGTRLGIASFHHQPPHNQPSPTNGFSTATSSPASAVTMSSLSPSHLSIQTGNHSTSTLPHRHHALSASSHHINANNKANQDLILAEQQNSNHPAKWGTISHGNSQQVISMVNENNNVPKYVLPSGLAPQLPPPNSLDNLQSFNLMPAQQESKEKALPTPTSTPTTSRKSRRRSNLFIPSSKKSDDKLKNSELGSGRAIPIKQGYLYKRSSKSLNKEWKKKYVTLCDDGRLTYHPSLHDYMDDVHGKEVSLQYVTVKVPGQKPRGSKSIITNSALIKNHQNGLNNNNHVLEGLGGLSLFKEKKDKDISKANSQTSGDESNLLGHSNEQSVIGSDSNTSKIEVQTPNVKKRHRRMKSSGAKNEYDEADGFEFYIVSLDSKQWHFEAANSEERDEWVYAIEQEIFRSLQGNESFKSKQTQQNPSDVASMVSIRQRVPGNGFCVDCDATNPEWASLNLGVLMCIECSGVHRNLGSHISKVRSLGLDEWPPGHLSVMLAMGNALANSVWEHNTCGFAKPTPTAGRDDKEKWIRAKYEAKQFLPPYSSSTSIGQQLIESVVKSDMKSITLLLGHSTNEHINCTVSSRDLRTPLHFACAIGNLAIAQLLIWNNANLKQTDHEGRTCLTYAKAANSLAIVKQSNGKPHHVTAETTTALVNLLTTLGCTDPHPLTGNTSGNSSGTLSRRRETIGAAPNSFEKLPSSVI